MSDYEHYISQALLTKRNHEDPSEELVQLILEASVIEYLSQTDAKLSKDMDEDELVNLLEKVHMEPYIDAVIDNLDE